MIDVYIGIVGRVASFPVGDDSSAHGLGMVVVPRVRRHGHCSLVNGTIRHDPALSGGAGQMVHV